MLFATGDGCALCHSASPTAAALWSKTGDDVSPHGLWEGSMMAHAAKDPYWRAQVAKETSRTPSMAAKIEELCVRCHTPMAHHTNRIAGAEPARVAAAATDPLFSDGVSCTVCHQIQAEGLGTSERFNGRVLIQPGRKIFGPYEDPGGQPMIMHSAFTPTHGSHIRSAALCGSCHTLHTSHAGTQFPEQSPYLEWRNSEFTDEAGRTETSRTCQECHMPEVGPMRVARNPAGADFNIKTRSFVRGHSFVGGNAFMLTMLGANREKLGISAPLEAFERNAKATRAQLSHATATISLENIRRETDGDGRVLVFDAVISNLTGHKFPTGYPSRRAWVQVDVRGPEGPIFRSGVFDEAGRLKGINEELKLPHYQTISEPSQVQVYEMVAADADGNPTTYLTEMAARMKDDRLLPRGYSASGPHAADTQPVGTAGDPDFGPGVDRVTYRVRLPKDAPERTTIVARVLYQTIPPAWVEAVRSVEAKEAKSFVEMYDAAEKTPEQIAVTVGFDGAQ